MKHLNCVLCGIELTGEIDTFGLIGQEMCWDCWSSEQDYDDSYYGMAPHHHDLSITGSYIGSTILDPLPERNENGAYWIESAQMWFRPDLEVDGAMGVWSKQS